MTVPNLGRLRDVEVRRAWSHEAYNFTPWLAANLDVLSDALGIPLELQGTEVGVGSFATDILAMDSQTGVGVVIENQLEPTDHSHLGQIMTYLAGLDAKIVVWIATQFREPHLSAIGWLNDHTEDPFAFFAVQVSAVQIGDSEIAPRFNVVGKPNEWERDLAEAVKRTSGELSEIGQARLAFWTGFLERFPDLENQTPANATSSRWYPVNGGNYNIVLYKSVQGGGIFIRGPRFESGEQTLERLAPHDKELRERLMVPDNASQYSNYIHIQPDETQVTVYDWLSDALIRYTQVLNDVLDRSGDDEGVVEAMEPGNS